jgi:hypothetical protein
VWRDNVVGAEGAWSEVGGRTRRSSLLKQALGLTCQRSRNMDAPTVSRGNGRLPHAQIRICTRRGELILEKQPGDKWRTLNLVGRVFRLCRLA